jgi:benzil reductase ((S)-benzoin forming)
MNLFVVTGASKGLGRALADLLARDEQNEVVEISRGVWSKNARNTAIEADFANLAQVDAAFARLAEGLKTPKVARAAERPAGHPVAHSALNATDSRYAFAALINNAGVVSPVARFDAIDSAALAHNLTVNLAAPIAATRAFAVATRGIAARRLVVNISSGAAKRPIRGWTAYCTAKAGLEMATRAMAEDARESDRSLCVCSLAPGVVDTPMQATVRSAALEHFPDRARFEQMKDSGALRHADDVARDIISLLHSDRLQNGGNYDIRELLNTHA